VVPPEHFIRAVLTAYEAAHDNRDAAALQRIVPTMSAEQFNAITKTFAGASSYSLELQVLSVTVSGSSAVATCLVAHGFVPKIGSATRTPPQETRFHLRQVSTDWIIERIERAPPR
jgi:hypothetical protein